MKAIYINLDPYLTEFSAWLRGVTVDPRTGETDTPPPAFDNVIPLSVTLPLGADCAVFVPYGGTADDPRPNTLTIDGVTVYVSGALAGTEIDTDVTPAFSAVGPATKYAVVAVPGDSVTVRFSITGADDVGLVEPLVTVLVRREQASGPVDLVDFTPPAAAPTAAQINAALGGTGAAEGQPLKGVSLANATNAPAPTAADIRSALVAAGNGALAGVNLGGAILVDGNADVGDPTLVLYDENTNKVLASAPGSLDDALGMIAS